MQATDKFQGKCLINSEGWQYMRWVFDRFPPRVRERLRDSPFNICAACVGDVANLGVGGSELAYLDAIDQIEARIRAGEPTTES